MKDKRRPRLILSDSESEENLIVSLPRRVDFGTNQDTNGSVYLKKNSTESPKPKKELGMDRKSIRSEHVIRKEDAGVGRNKFEGDGTERKRSRFDIFEYDEDDEFDRKKAKMKVLDGDEIGIGGSRLPSKPVVSGGRQREFKSGCSRNIEIEKRKHSNFDRTSSLLVKSKHGTDRSDRNKDGSFRPVGVLKGKFRVPSDESIRVQGKNGVLKVMLHNRNKVGGSQKSYGDWEAEENRKKGSRSADTVRAENKHIEKPVSVVLTEKFQPTLRKCSSTKKNIVHDWKTEDSDTSSRLGSKRVSSCSFKKEASGKGDRTLNSDILQSTKSKEGSVKHGSGTEKQLVRERIKGILLSAGWTIDSRPRRNREYYDSVYISPTGTAYWSVVKAYDALQKQFKDEDDKLSGTSSSFTLIPEEDLKKLTRQTRKKIEIALKNKQRNENGHNNAKGTVEKKSAKFKHVIQSGKSLKRKADENGYVSSKTKGHTKSEKSTHLSHGFNYLNMKSLLHEQGNSTSSSHKGMLKSARVQKPFSASDPHLLLGRKIKKQSGIALLVRGSNKGKSSDTDDFIPYTGKRTVLSWMIDLGTVQLSEKVQYMNKRRTRVMLEGWITRDGIHCGCCSKILTVSKFEIHAGSKLRQPFQNIYVETGVSLLQCQLDTWNKQAETERSGFHVIDFNCDDPNDDTCGICGDGGDLICCDGCPSTFHQSCLGIQMLPSGDWHCLNCSCKFCGIVGGCTDEGDDDHDNTISGLLTCSLCEEKYHQLCIKETDGKHAAPNGLRTSFCGQKCRQLSEQLQKLLGVKHELEAGFSWTLIQRFDVDSDTSLRGLPQRAECNSKLAVALTVMDECFLPIIDRRTGINLIHNVLYNCGSNFNRMNYSGFYTAILERGDEIVVAASIRIHGTQLAEMPFIGTRHIYRRQGMCRQLLSAIESALCSLNVEKLLIPALSELMHTWTTVFGFKPLEESHKQEVKSMNMLVFPSTDMLQKLLLKHEFAEGNITDSAVVKSVELKINHQIMPEVADKSDMGFSAGPDFHVSDEGVVCHAHETNDAVAAVESGSQVPGCSLYNTSEVIPLDASHESELQSSDKGTVICNFQIWDKLSESPTNTNCLIDLGGSHDDKLEVQNKSLLDSPGECNIESSAEGSADDTHEVNAKVLALVSIRETCAQYTTVKINEYHDAVSCSNFEATDGSTVRCNSDMNQHNICEVERTSFVASHFVSGATHCEENIPESRGADACELKTESATVEPDCYTHDECSLHHFTGITTQPQDAVFTHGFQGSSENIIHHEVDGISQICRDSEEIIKCHGSVSEHKPPESGKILVHRDSQLSQKVAGCSVDESDTVLDTHEVTNEVAAFEHNSQVLGEEPVDCASEVVGESLYPPSTCIYPASVECKSSEFLLSVTYAIELNNQAYCEKYMHCIYDLKDEVAAIECEFHSLERDSLNNESKIIIKSSDAIGSDFQSGSYECYTVLFSISGLLELWL
ncbi:hypothetical protein HHK36_020609 [Tetracentron sinense]|uniref:PHD-type domain-containing protein n=1 Tax=Tetracentron sinense TaxID=13715 RepID=A0A834YZA7_TETSI|nr:hypothetical protein HHK36_020609 [Tetracentron sinense]